MDDEINKDYRNNDLGTISNSYELRAVLDATYFYNLQMARTTSAQTL